MPERQAGNQSETVYSRGFARGGAVGRNGIDPIHLGCVIVMNLSIGLVTPPVGINLYVACGISGTSLKAISRAVVPFVIASIFTLLLITYIPPIATWLPSILVD